MIVNDEKEKTKKRKKVLLVLLIFLLLLAGVVAFSFFQAGSVHTSGGGRSLSSQSSPGSSSLDDNSSALPGGYTAKSQQEILSELQKEQVTVTDKVSAQASFPNGTGGATGTWVVENTSSNKVIEQCEIALGGKTVAKSAPIYPGQHIESISLSQKVDAGTYDVTAVISYYSTDTKAYLGRAGYQIKLTVS